MKKIIIFVLCLTLALLSGCSSTNQNFENDQPQTDVNSPVEIQPDLSTPEEIEPPIEPDVVPPTDTPIEPEISPPEDPPSSPSIPETDVEEDEEERKKVYIRSNANGLRVRNKANLSSSVIGLLDKNDMVTFIGMSGDFFITEFKEQKAYVYSDMCTLVEVDVQNENVEKAIDIGSQLLGHPYVWGSQRYHWGNGKLNKNFKAGEFDCSALVQYVYYKSCGVLLDVTSRAQSLNGTPVKRSELRRGDLMFFTNASRYNKTGIERIGHVGIYFGDNYILHTASDHAVIEPISSTRWSYYVSARRVA